MDVNIAGKSYTIVIQNWFPKNNLQKSDKR